MATVAERLATARANFAQQLEELSDPARRRPNYSIGGRSVSWQDYMRFLMESIKDLDSQIASSDPVDVITAIE